MKLSIDSSDSLDDALRAVGALFGVTLQVADTTGAASGGPAETPTAPARKTASRTAAGRGRGRSTGTGRRSAGRRGRAPAATDVRQWARDNGMTVNSRGRIPASVLAAYRESSGR